MKIISHITINGNPCCTYHAPWFENESERIKNLCGRCGYRSFNQARIAARNARDYRVKAVKGECPEWTSEDEANAYWNQQ